MIEQHEAARALARVASAHGGLLTPEAVVKEAADPASPLHRYFEWDNRKAAHQFRIEQARRLIRSVEIDVSVSASRSVVVAPRYVSAPTRSGYLSISDLSRDPDEARAAVVAEMTRAAAALRRARTIAAVLEGVDLIEDLLDGVGRATRRFGGAGVDGPGARQ
jgi:EAL domain-containing protein (putative c-di-GMP-specific phosphodiesterase class I)